MEILNYNEQVPGGHIIAIFDIYWGPQFGMTFKKWKLMNGKKGEFVAGPSYSVEGDLLGKKDWFPYIEFSREKGPDFQKKVMHLLEPFRKATF